VRKFHDVSDNLIGVGAADHIVSFLLDGALTQPVADLFSKLRIAAPRSMRSL
jgi:hypothetical protein